jgi:hypothetical protein
VADANESDVNESDVNEMEPVRPRKRARSFGSAAALYDAVRPSYPEDAIRWALAPLGAGRHRVADIGAGSGILTRVIASVGHEPVALEPDALMRDRFIAATPGVEVVDGDRRSRPFGSRYRAAHVGVVRRLVRGDRTGRVPAHGHVHS